jgi:hypothetical protein
VWVSLPVIFLEVAQANRGVRRTMARYCRIAPRRSMRDARTEWTRHASAATMLNNTQLF